MIVLDISTVALSTEAMIRLEQSWELFCLISRTKGELVVSAFSEPTVLVDRDSEIGSGR